jgi:hypothetical protein
MNKMYWKGRIRKMKKILKRVIATVAAFAFAAAGLVVAPKTAKAAGTTVKVYVELTSGKTAEYYKGNVWGGTASVATAATAAKPTKWGTGTLPVGDAVTEGGKNYAVFTINNADEVQGFQVVGYADGTAVAEYQEDAWNSEVVAQSNGKAYFDLTSKKLFKDAAMTQEIAPLPVTDVLSVVGTITDTGFDLPGKAMTKNGDTYTITFKNVAAGSYTYKFLQSSAEYSWKYQIGKDNSFGDNTANFELVLDEVSDVTFTVKVTDVTGLDAKQITAVEYAGPTVTPVKDNKPAEDNKPADDNKPAEDNKPADDNKPAGGNNGNVSAGDSMAVATAIIAAAAACGIVVVSFKKRRQDA